jgi:hypothetical protein
MDGLQAVTTVDVFGELDWSPTTGRTRRWLDVVGEDVENRPIADPNAPSFHVGDADKQADRVRILGRSILDRRR